MIGLSQTTRGTRPRSPNRRAAGVKALHAALEAAGAAVGALRVNTPMGLDIFELADPDGHRIAFARDTSAGRTGPGLKG
jgi:hypothetical protein